MVPSIEVIFQLEDNQPNLFRNRFESRMRSHATHQEREACRCRDRPEACCNTGPRPPWEELHRERTHYDLHRRSAEMTKAMMSPKQHVIETNSPSRCQQAKEQRRRRQGQSRKNSIRLSRRPEKEAKWKER